MADLNKSLRLLKASGVEVIKGVAPQKVQSYIFKRGTEQYSFYEFTVAKLAERGKLTWDGIKEQHEKSSGGMKA